MDPMERGEGGGGPVGGRLLDFARWLLTTRHIAPTTIKAYCSTVRAQLRLVLGWQYAETPLWKAFLKKLEGVPREQKFRDPATRQLLELCYGDERASLGVRTLLVVGWNGLHRPGELCASPDWRAHRDRTLLADDVSTFAGATVAGYKILLRHLKQDAYNTGPYIHYNRRVGDTLCPVAALDRYIGAFPQAKETGYPFFIRDITRGVPRYVYHDDVSQLLKLHAAAAGLNPQYISGASLRTGGAQHLASTNMPLELIQQRGRWSAEGFNTIVLMYTRMSEERLRTLDAAFLAPSSHPLMGRRHAAPPTAEWALVDALEAGRAARQEE